MKMVSNAVSVQAAERYLKWPRHPDPIKYIEAQARLKAYVEKEKYLKAKAEL